VSAVIEHARAVIARAQIDRESAILSDLIRRQSAGTLTGEAALHGIARIAELRAFVDALRPAASRLASEGREGALSA
jgi:hypothetical protein